MVDFRTGPGSGGPECKYYFMTPLGLRPLPQFTKRHIALFYNEDIRKLLF